MSAGLTVANTLCAMFMVLMGSGVIGWALGERYGRRREAHYWEGEMARLHQEAARRDRDLHALMVDHGVKHAEVERLREEYRRTYAAAGLWGQKAKGDPGTN